MLPPVLTYRMFPAKGLLVVVAALPCLLVQSVAYASDSTAPSFASTETGLREVAEGTSAGTAIGAPAAATDPDPGDSVEYSLVGTDAAAFDLDDATGQLRTSNDLDYETKSEYSVKVIATDTTALTDEIDVTITVTNEDEAGSVSMFPAQLNVRSVVRATLTDPDGSLTSVSWQWAKSSDGTIWADISGATVADYMPTSVVEGQYLRATASYTDGHGRHIPEPDRRARA